VAERRFRSLCVYCGSSNEVDPRWLDVARAMGKSLAARGIDVVFGGGHVGLMGAVADAALAAGGRVHGVIPEKLFELELAHEGVTTLEVVRTMHERKLRMAERSDGFVALPGGFGTLEEIFEATTWTQLGYHDKPVGLVDAHGFYQPILQFVDQAVELGFIQDHHRSLLLHAPEITELVETMKTIELPNRPRWVNRP